MSFLLVVSSLSPASAFRHQDSVRYRWSWISPPLPSVSSSVANEKEPFADWGNYLELKSIKIKFKKFAWYWTCTPSYLRLTCNDLY
jgi:hypothetical protein